MKKILALSCLLFSGSLVSGFSAVAITPEQFASITPQIQEQIVIQQTTSTGSAGLRYASANGYYAAFQTFTWSESGGMDGLGVKLVANSNNINTPGYSYYLRLFAVDGLTSGAQITETLGEYTFELVGDYRSVNDYLYFRLPEVVALSSGETYAFEIVGVGTANSRLTLATAQSGTSDYTGGTGLFANGSGALSDNGIPGEISGTNINGYVFFATAAIPEAGSASLLLMGLGLGLVVLYRQKRVKIVP